MKTCGVLLGAISQRFDTIVEFDVASKILFFESKGRFRREKHQNSDVKVKVVA